MELTTSSIVENYLMDKKEDGFEDDEATIASGVRVPDTIFLGGHFVTSSTVGAVKASGR